MNINIEDFKKIEIRVGKIIEASKIEDADKLLKLEVDFGHLVGSVSSKRQIVSGIAEFYKPEDLIGKMCPFIVNLEPRVICGVESQGMIMAVGDGETVSLLHPDKEIKEGSEVR